MVGLTVNYVYGSAQVPVGYYELTVFSPVLPGDLVAVREERTARIMGCLTWINPQCSVGLYNIRDGYIACRPLGSVEYPPRPLPIEPSEPNMTPVHKCPKCGITLHQIMGYVCPDPLCPCFPNVTCGSANATGTTGPQILMEGVGGTTAEGAPHLGDLPPAVDGQAVADNIKKHGAFYHA